MVRSLALALATSLLSTVLSRVVVIDPENPSLPDDVTGITELQMYSVQVTEVTDFLCKLESLEVLFVKNCVIGETIPECIGQLSNLAELSLIGNSLKGEVPSSFSELSALWFLELEETNLSRLDRIGIIPRLETLLLSKYTFTSVPNFLSSLQGSLIELAFLDCVFLESLSGDTLPDLPNLKTLNFQGTELSDGELPDSVSRLQLEFLYLASSNVARLPKGSENMIYNLIELSLPHQSLVCDRFSLSSLGPSSIWASLLQPGVEETIWCSEANGYAGMPVHRLNLLPDEPEYAPSGLSGTQVKCKGLDCGMTVRWNAEEFIGFTGPVESDDKFQNWTIFSNILKQEDAVGCEENFSADYLVDIYPVTIFKIQWRSLDEKDWKQNCTARNVLNVTNLLPYQTYEFRIVAANAFLKLSANSQAKFSLSYSLGPQSKSVKLQTSESYPDTIPRDVKVVDNSLTNASVSLTWEAPSPPRAKTIAYSVVIKPKDSNTVVHNVTVLRPDVKIVNKLHGDTFYEISIFAKNEFGVGPSFHMPLRTEASCVEGERQELEPYECVPCGPNLYGNGAGNCASCGDKFPVTLSSGAKTSDECLTDVFFYKYWNSSDDGKWERKSCYDTLETWEQIDCSTYGLFIPTVGIQPGYWRASNLTMAIVACRKPEFCLGTEPIPNVAFSSSSMREMFSSDPGTNFEYSNSICAEHHSGVMCLSCEEGFGMTASGCKPCDEETTAAHKGAFIGWTVLAVLVVAAIPVFLILKVWLPKHATGDDDENGQDGKASSSNGLLSRIQACGAGLEDFAFYKIMFNITLGFYQVALAFAAMTNLFLKTDEVDSASVVVNLDLSPVLDAVEVSCYADSTYYAQLLIYTLMPLAMLACIWGMSLLLRKFLQSPLTAAEVMGFSLSVTVNLLLLIYPGVSTKIFKTFLPKELKTLEGTDNGYRTLEGDVRLFYDSEESQGWRLYAGFMILVYPIGVVCLFVYLTKLTQKWTQMLPSDRTVLQEEMLGSTSVLTSRYRNPFFETFELTRKLLMTAVTVVIFHRSENIGVAIFMVLCVTTVLYQGLARPYKDTRALILGITSMILLFMLGILWVIRLDFSNNEEPFRALAIFIFTLEAVVVAGLLFVPYVLKRRERFGNPAPEEKVQQEGESESTSNTTSFSLHVT